MSAGPDSGPAPEAPPAARAGTRASRARHAVRSLTADVGPLRDHADYRRLWGGVTVSFLGSQLTAVAVPLQVFALTHSSLAVGMVGLVMLVPLVGFGLVGGAIADATDRRRLVLLTSSCLTALSALLTVQAALHADRLWLLYVIAAAQAGFFSVDSPARGAIIPRLLPPRELPAANALSQLGISVGLAGGPLLAGVLVGTAGFAWAYGVDTLTFAAALYAVWRLPPVPPEGGGQRAGVASVLEGLRFLRGRPNLLMTFLVDINAMVFGMPRALFPALAGAFYLGGAGTAGLLYAAPNVGALLAAGLSGWAGRIRRQGLAVLVSVAVWGAAIAGFGLSRVLWVGLVLLAVAGAADMVSAIFRNTILQVATPDALRGRLQGVFIVVVTGGPRLGDVEAGTVASVFSPAVSVVSGGLICVAGVFLLAALFPSFARYDARHPEP